MPHRFPFDMQFGDGVSPVVASARRRPGPTQAKAAAVRFRYPRLEELSDAESPPAPAIPPEPAELPEGALASPGHPGSGHALGQNSFLRAEWLPPDPPTGHGPHDYVFQIFALRQSLALAEAPGRGALIDAMRGHVLAKGTLTGVYYRS